MEVRVPFLKQFKDPMLRDQKTWTSRTQQYGEAGDTFKAFGSTFEIKAVFKLELKDVAINYKLEGCHSIDDFVSLWIKIYPRQGYVPSQLVWVHVFWRIQ